MNNELAAAIELTLRLALSTSAILLMLGVPLAWWLSQGPRRLLKDVVSIFTTLPLILPPTVLGFYILLLLAPNGAVGELTSQLGLTAPAFTFEGLVIGSTISSMPFMVQPVRNAFIAIGAAPLEAAATLRASPLRVFTRVALPLAGPAILTGTIMSFAHTIGEFGVVLMVGGSIPGETKVLSTFLYELVESQQEATAHLVAGGLVLFACLIMFLAHRLNSPQIRTAPE